MRRFSASPRLGPSARQSQGQASQLRFGTLFVAALPETPSPSASDTELGEQSENASSLRSWLAFQGRKPVCSRHGHRTPVTFASTHWHRSPREPERVRVCVSMRARVPQRTRGSGPYTSRQAHADPRAWLARGQTWEKGVN